MNGEKQRFVDFVYNLDKLNAIFALSSVALAISMVWMVWADYDREWKDVQRAAMTMEQHKVESDIAVAEAAIDQDRLSAIDSRLKEVEASIESKADELNGVQDSLEILRGEFYIADQNSKYEKAVYDVAKYQYEEAAHHHHEAEAAEKGELWSSQLAAQPLPSKEECEGHEKENVLHTCEEGRAESHARQSTRDRGALLLHEIEQQKCRSIEELHDDL